MYDMKHAKNRRWARRKMIRMGLMKSDFVTGPFKGKDWSHEAAFTAKKEAPLKPLK